MDIEDSLKTITSDILKKMGLDFSKITVTEEEKDDFSINIESSDTSLLIGYHGENIQALQHIVKVLAWKEHANEQFNIIVDVDNYRKRQEENVISITERKIEALRRTGRPQMLPPMSPYFRRKVHMHCMGAGYDDIETDSQGDGETRHIILKLK